MSTKASTIYRVVYASEKFKHFENHDLNMLFSLLLEKEIKYRMVNTVCLSRLERVFLFVCLFVFCFYF